MRPDLELLRADIESELEKLERLREEFAPHTEKLALGPEEATKADKTVIGYILHNFYNGCDNIFLSIAPFFENELDGSAWPKDLLKRMSLDIRGFSPK